MIHGWTRLLVLGILLGGATLVRGQGGPPEPQENQQLLEMLERARQGGEQAEKMGEYRKELMEGAKAVWWAGAALVVLPVAFFLFRFLYNLTLGSLLARWRLRSVRKARSVPVEESLRAQAERLAREGRAIEASRMLADLGAGDRAMDLLRKAQAWAPAADLAERLGKVGEAAEIYGRLNNWVRSAELFESNKDFSRAAEAWGKAGRPDLVARARARNGQHREAGALFEGLGDPLRGAMEFEKAGETSRAADLYVRAVQQGARYAGSVDFDPAAIARTLERVRKFEQAAEVYISSRQLLEAIGLYLRIGNLEQATRLYCECGGSVGETLLLSGSASGVDREQILKVFLEAKDFERAGRLYETLGQWLQAGECFERAGAQVRAGRAFARAGHKERAAAAFARGGDVDGALQIRLDRGDKVGAADVAMAAGRYLQAGRWLMEAGQRERAFEALQRVPEGSADAPAAQDLLRGMVRTLREENLLIEEEGFAQALREQRVESPAEMRTRAAAEGSVETGPIVVRQEGVDLLRNVGAFRALPLPMIKGLAEASERKTFQAGEVILEEDAEGAGLYVIRRGSVGVYKRSMKAPERIATLAAGEHFAEMSLIEGSKTSARIRAEEPTECLFIKRDTFINRVEANPVAAAQVYREFALTLSRRLRTTSAEMARLRAS